MMPVLVLAFLAAIGGLINLPFPSLEFLDHWLEPVFRGVAEARARLVLGGARSRRARGRRRARRHPARLRASTAGPRGPSRDPLDERLGRSRRVLGHAYYYDDGIAAARRRPAPARRAWLADVFDQKIIDGAVNGVAAARRDAGAAAAQVQTGLRAAATRSAIASGTVALLLYVADLGRGGRR